MNPALLCPSILDTVLTSIPFCKAGVAQDQPFFHRAVQACFQHIVHPPDIGDTQPRLFVFDFFPDSAVFPKLVVQPLDIHSLKLIQFDIAQLEIYLEQIFVFQDIFKNPGKLAILIRLCSYLLFDLRCSVS